MGGKLFNDNVRLERDQYVDLSNRVVATLMSVFLDRKISIIPAYFTKPSFGDCDILITKPSLTNTQILDVLGIDDSRIHRNGPIISFQKEQFQFDLIFVSEDDFNSSLHYFSFDPLGNLMGRIAHKCGFKYGHDGLSFIVREGDYEFAVINVSKDMPLIFQFLGYDYTRFTEGFEYQEDIFKYATSTSLFNRQIYQLANRSHISRTRDKKRESYRLFLNWLDEQTDLVDYDGFLGVVERGGYSKNPFFFNIALGMFPGFSENYLETMRNFEEHKKFKEKFNGELVRQLTGLTGKELGYLMKKIRESDNFREFVMESDAETLDNWIMFQQDKWRESTV